MLINHPAIFNLQHPITFARFFAFKALHLVTMSRYITHIANSETCHVIAVLQGHIDLGLDTRLLHADLHQALMRHDMSNAYARHCHVQPAPRQRNSAKSHALC